MNNKFSDFLKTQKGKSTVAALLTIGVSWSAFGLWQYSLPKFQDLTIELGTEQVVLREFLTEDAVPGMVQLLSDPAEVDLNHVGQSQLQLRHGAKEETVTLTVEDTEVPQVQFITSRTETGSYVPDPMDFVESVVDADQTTVSFAEPVTVPEDYSDLTFTVVVSDSSGNKVQQECSLHFSWLRESVALEYGEALTREDLLLSPETDSELISDAVLNKLNTAGVGTYPVEVSVGGKTETCQVTVQDTLAPTLTLQEVPVYPGNAVELADFVVSAEDASGDVELTLLTPLDNRTEGEHTVTIQAKDVNGNVTTADTILRVTKDRTAPTLKGLDKLVVYRGQTPDYLAGVYAEDNESETCQITVDHSALDLNDTGTYYISYTATDLAGNSTTKTRRVRVVHNEEETAAMIAQHAEACGPDILDIRNYVRNLIRYSTNWGGDDPVWYGFTNRKGNCYVHAMCLKAILDYHGYESQLIWVTNKTHYWLVVKLDEGWRHIDATPTSKHSIYKLMTDDQRYWTLSGRNWDRDAWPKCE